MPDRRPGSAEPSGSAEMPVAGRPPAGVPAPASADRRPAGTTGPASATPGGHPAGSADDPHAKTVDLASHLLSAPATDPGTSSGPDTEPDPETAPGSDPDTTAILELRPTVDLSSRLDHPQEDSHQRR